MIKFFIDTTVDTVQSGKKIAVDTLVKHEGLAKSLNTFVDTQTEYTKKAIDASIAAGTEVYKTVTDKAFYIDTLKSAKNIYTQKKGK